MTFSQINPYDKDKILNYEWISPSNKKYTYKVTCQDGWNYTWLSLNEGERMEEGVWEIRVFEGKTKRVESHFEVSTHAKLYYPAKID